MQTSLPTFLCRLQFFRSFYTVPFLLFKTEAMEVWADIHQPLLPQFYFLINILFGKLLAKD